MTQAGTYPAPAGVPEQAEAVAAAADELEEPGAAAPAVEVDPAKPWLAEETIEIDLDMDRMSLGDIEDLEDITGQSIRKLGKELTASGEDMDIKVMRAIAWIALRKRWPEMTFEDTRDIPFASFIGDALVEGEAAAGPVDPPA